MTRRAIALGALAGLALSAPAHAAVIARFYNPLDGCTYTVWGPDIRPSGTPQPGIHTSGGFGETVECP